MVTAQHTGKTERDANLEAKIWERAIALFDKGIFPPTPRQVTVSFFGPPKPHAAYDVNTYVNEGEDLVSRVAGVKALSAAELKRMRSDFNGQVEQGLIDQATDVTIAKYGMDLRWATGFYVEIPLLGNIITNRSAQTGIVNVEGFGQFPAFTVYRYRGKSIDDLLSADPVSRTAHELVHVARWPLHNRKFEELFAYRAGGTPLGKGFDLLFAYNNDVESYGGAALMAAAKLPFGRSKLVQVPIALCALFVGTAVNPFINGVRLFKALRTFNHAHRELVRTFGPENGNYIFGRLSADDLEHIQTVKPDLKEHFASTEGMKGLDRGYSVRAELFKRKLGVSTCYNSS